MIINNIKDISDRFDSFDKIRLVEVDAQGFGNFREELSFKRFESYSFLPELYDFCITDRTLIYYYLGEGVSFE